MVKRDAGATTDETVDGILQGKLSIIQRRTGYRFSIDALLLAHFVAPGKYDRIVDLGSGSGVIALILATLHPYITVYGVELQAGLAARARRSAELNGLSGRVTIHDGNVRAISGVFPPRTVDVVVANPPYRLAASGRINPDAEKRVARHEVEARLDDFAARRFSKRCRPPLARERQGRVRLSRRAPGRSRLRHARTETRAEAPETRAFVQRRRSESRVARGQQRRP
jgi:tRNA1(Val) A37 N6-methylase TrmN6